MTERNDFQQLCAIMFAEAHALQTADWAEVSPDVQADFARGLVAVLRAIQQQAPNGMAASAWASHLLAQAPAELRDETDGVAGQTILDAG